MSYGANGIAKFPDVANWLAYGPWTQAIRVRFITWVASACVLARASPQRHISFGTAPFPGSSGPITAFRPYGCSFMSNLYETRLLTKERTRSRNASICEIRIGSRNPPIKALL